ncbi:hypothetical protein CTEN210_13321 [Chaetoceros tenuissimus]|uniref:Uncharacterized protein n=1 Tax=Chaetoceros tenuissimus TaxID=426638 RepID=A0AAD3D5C7_9STRA|nr:hypothetical protein CTEN210_13321 [Chaetoceros tenuissimus]
MQNQANQQPPQAAAAAAVPPLPQWQIDANNLGLDVEERELHRLLCDFHNFTRAQYVALREEGYGTLHELRNWKHKDIRSLLKDLSNRPNTRGGQRFGDKRIREVQAIAWFVNDATSRGVPINLAVYQHDPDVCMQNSALAADHVEQDTTKAGKPDKFEYANWITWEESVEVYLESVISNANGAPLSYVIRKDLPPNTNWNSLDKLQQRIYTPVLQGFAFNLDTKEVLTLMKELCLGTDAEVWIKNIKCGRLAMIALHKQCDGPDEAKKRTLEAEAKLKKLCYKYEHSFPFEKFITRMENCFKVFERYNMPMYEQQKVEKLFDKCQNSHPEFKMEVALCRSQQTTFIGAITYLKVAVARIFPDDKRGGGRQRQIAAVGKKINGVDLSDFSKTYSADEVRKLKSTKEGKDAWFAFLRDPRRKSKRKEYNKRKNSDQRKIQALEKKLKAAEESPNTNNDDGSNMDESQQRMVAATITGVMNASRQNAQQIQFPLNGRHASIRSAQRSAAGSDGGSVVSGVTQFDHLGNPL